MNHTSRSASAGRHRCWSGRVGAPRVCILRRMHAWYDTGMTRRITITLPDELVSAIDEEAAEEGMSRSALIREASSRYVAGMQAEDADLARAAAVRRTIGFLDELEGAPVLDSRSVEDVLREIRGPLEPLTGWDEEQGEGP